MFAKMVLPRLGGAPGVWSVALVFFQGVLLAGYAYAHLLIRYVGPKAGACVHIAVLLLGALFLPLALAAGWGRPPAEGQIFYLLGLFGVSIGVPFFALSANAPLLQAWFARTGAPGGEDPYFLYGASNLGSFIALLGYPFIIEPALTLTEQTHYWSAGYVVLLLSIAALGLYANRGAINVEPVRAVSPPITPIRRLVWIFLAFVPTALLVAVTAHISTDVAAAPFLWVIPLAIFLLTFVLVFRERPVIPYYLLAILLPALLIFVATDYLIRGILPTLWLIGLHLVTFFVAVMAAHSRLYALRPPADRLTEFYLWMSLGGVLGGAFTGLAAPYIFPTILEYPILLVATLLVLVRPERLDKEEIKAALTILAAGLIISIFAWTTGKTLNLDQDNIFKIAVFTLVAVILLISRMWRLVTVALLAFTMLVGGIVAPKSGTIELTRSFFGVHKIQDYASGIFRVLFNGTTLHGAAQIENGKPRAGWPEPLTYYHTQSPMAEVIRAAREAGHSVRLSPVGIVGLGTGSLACYKEQGETWHFYEIDQQIIDIARDSGKFKFLPACAPDAEIRLGDARITLAEAKEKYELLLIDAFSSDAIPIHLLTKEALQLYFDHLAPNGVLVLHISNRHLDLLPEVGALARDLDLVAWSKMEDAKPDYGPRLLATSQVVALARYEQALGALPSLEGWTKMAVDPEQKEHRAWTDDYSDIFGAFRRQLKKLGY
ncbi:fused MFS/spermidine synthase [Terrihabitans soli]|nr:fused MFS/spermidine synthase [Terrihabitans soli]